MKDMAAVITYRVVHGRVMAADVVNLSEATTVQGKTVRISSGGGVKVNDAVITPQN